MTDDQIKAILEGMDNSTRTTITVRWIYKKNDKKFYIDSSGNLHFEGDLTGATGTFSGALKGGSINLGNGTFMVDSDGNMIANSGTFGGTLNGADGTFSGKVQAGEIVSSKIIHVKKI